MNSSLSCHQAAPLIPSISLVPFQSSYPPMLGVSQLKAICLPSVHFSVSYQIPGPWFITQEIDVHTSGSSHSSLLLASMNLGHIQSHNAWPYALQLAHNTFPGLPQGTPQSNVLCHMFCKWWTCHTPQLGDWTTWTGTSGIFWALFFFLLVHTHLPEMRNPSLLA